MRLTIAVLAVICAALCAGASPICVHGQVPLSLGAQATGRDWCSAGGCVLEFAFQFDPTVASGRLWPLNASIGSGLPGSTRKVLTQLFPNMNGMTMQCLTSGDIIFTTPIGLNNERLRFIWSYNGISSFTCDSTFDDLELTTDFKRYQALLSYSGGLATFDATFLSLSANYSLGELSADPSHGCFGTGTVTNGGHTAGECTISDCRYPASLWLGKLKHNAAWAAIAGKTFCGVDYATIMKKPGNYFVKQMQKGWLAEARQLITCELNAARSGCALPTELDFVTDSLDYLSNPLNCAQGQGDGDRYTALVNWNDQMVTCKAVNDPVAADNGANGEAIDVDAKKNAYIYFWAMIGLGIALIIVVCCCVCTLWCARWSIMREINVFMAKYQLGRDAGRFRGLGYDADAHMGLRSPEGDAYFGQEAGAPKMTRDPFTTSIGAEAAAAVQNHTLQGRPTGHYVGSGADPSAVAAHKQATAFWQ
jgi:hypothetical protein